MLSGTIFLPLTEVSVTSPFLKPLLVAVISYQIAMEYEGPSSFAPRVSGWSIRSIGYKKNNSEQ